MQIVRDAFTMFPVASSDNYSVHLMIFMACWQFTIVSHFLNGEIRDFSANSKTRTQGERVKKAHGT